MPDWCPSEIGLLCRRKEVGYMSPTNLDYEELKQEALRQIQRNPLGVLATAEGNSVTARTIMLIYDGLKILFFTPTWTRKFKQISANKNVSLALNNIQIDGVASIKGHTSNNENTWLLKALEKLAPEMYKGYRDELMNPEMPWQVIEIAPKRIALFSGLPDRHLDVLDIIEKTAIRYYGREGFPPNY
jgi:general stress protein 26